MEKILVIQTAFIGDALLTLPMIEKLKEKIPESQIDVLAIPSTEEVFKLSPFINEIIILDKRGIHRSIFSLLKFVKGLRKNKYSMIYSPHRSLRTAIIVMQLGVRETYGFSNSSLMHIYKHMIDYRYDHHEVQRNLDLIGYNYDGSGWKFVPACQISMQEKNKINTLISETGNPSNFAVIAPGSVWDTKIYPKNYLLEVINFLRETSFAGGKIFLIGSEADKNYCNEIASNFDNKLFSVAGELTIPESIELMKRSKFLLTNDSAPTHMGMCAGIPVLTLYCSTVPQFGFYPYYDNSAYLSYDDLTCKPCGIHGFESCPLKHFDCGIKLKPDLVISKIKEMMNEKGN
jgi:lipopolysaccharide heptosyltransferase II